MAGVPSASSGVNSGSLGNLQLQPIGGSQTVQPVNMAINQPAAATTSNSSDTSGGLGSLLSGAIGTAANIYGSQNAAEDISQSEQAAIGVQNQTLGNINNLFTPQTTLGNNAMNTLDSTLGVNGQPANYNNFLNMPGYQFAVQQGTQALQRQAAASGSAYTPNTGAAIGQYVTGTAMQDYNTYISQLQNAAGLGAQANNTLSGANLTVGGNISQLLQNSGMAQASGVSAASGAIGNFLNQNSGTIGSAIQKGYNYLTGGPSSYDPATSPFTGAPGQTSVDWGMSNTTPSATDLATTAPSAAPIGSDVMAGYGGVDASSVATGAGGGIGNIAGDAGATAAAAYAPSLLAPAAPGAIDTMALAQSGYASLGGVPGSIAAADTSAGATGAGSGALGAAGPYIAAAAPLALAAYGASKPGVQLTSQWYNNFGNTVGAGLDANATPEQKLQAASMLSNLGLMQANGTGGSSGLSTASDFNFGRLMDVLKPYGVTNLQQAQALANQLINSIPPGQMPTANAHPMIHPF